LQNQAFLFRDILPPGLGWFGHEINGPEAQGIEGFGGPCAGQGAEHDRRGGVFDHDMLQGGEPVHFGHIDIQRDDIRFEARQQIQGFPAVGRLSHHLNLAIGGEQTSDRCPDQAGIVHDQKPDWILGRARNGGGRIRNRQGFMAALTGEQGLLASTGIVREFVLGTAFFAENNQAGPL
jgi:hypothetical protein